RLLEEQKAEFDELAKNIKQGGVNKMGEFVSNVARLLDETKAKEYMQGKLEGKLEGKKEIAKRMIALGISKDIISKVTDLSIEEIEKISKENIN
ncbi:carbamoyl-phosphate synthetase large chain oligomerization, partial [Caldicellulosiruptoraceae bacterium PP1]